jgi:hypothetical protein
MSRPFNIAARRVREIMSLATGVLRLTTATKSRGGLAILHQVDPRCSMTAAGATCDNMPAKGLKNLCNTLRSETA